MEQQLPKLIKVNRDRPKKKKILLLSDDLTMHSGIATMSKEFVIGTAEHYDWVQIAAGIDHPKHGQFEDFSNSINELLGIDHSYVKLYYHNGYGNPPVLREIIALEKPDLILHFTDPRFWGWLYSIEDEIRKYYKIPIAYYNIWDAPPAPLWNYPFYKSCDLIMNISKQTHALTKIVLRDEYADLDEGETKKKNTDVLLSYVPHGINEKMFYPINEDSEVYKDYLKFKEEFYSKNPNANFIVFWNNRNAARKQPADVILGFKYFCDKLSKADAKKCVLLMHTQIIDMHGTDLMSIKQDLCPDYNVIFSDHPVDTHVMNFFYNVSDVTVNIANNEGFGLSGAESLMSGTMIINNVTGGLQDQCGFLDEKLNPIKVTKEFVSNHTGKYKNHGSWARPIYPTSRSLQGSPPTPYIFNDKITFTDLADALFDVYEYGPEARKVRGLEGREFVLSKESGMSATEMCNRMKKSIDYLFDTWKPNEKWIVKRAKKYVAPKNMGIVI